MQDNSTQQGGVLSTRQEKKLRKSQTADVSCNLQDMMQSHQPDETGSGAPSGVGASGKPARDYFSATTYFSTSIQRQQEILNILRGHHQIQCQQPLNH